MQANTSIIISIAVIFLACFTAIIPDLISLYKYRKYLDKVRETIPNYLKNLELMGK